MSAYNKNGDKQMDIGIHKISNHFMLYLMFFISYPISNDFIGKCFILWLLHFTEESGSNNTKADKIRNLAEIIENKAYQKENVLAFNDFIENEFNGRNHWN